MARNRNDAQNTILLALGLAGVSLVLGVLYAIYKNPVPKDRPVASQDAVPAGPTLSIAEADAILREGVQAVSSLILPYLAEEQLISRTAAAMAFFARGKLPKDALSFLRPKGRFRVIKKRGKLYIHPDSYKRYDEAAKLFESLDARAAIALYAKIKPALQTGCEDLGYTYCGPDQNLSGTIRLLLSTPQIEGDVQVVPKVLSYAFADKRLEELTPAQKLLLRMGPENGSKVRAKLRELAEALGIST